MLSAASMLNNVWVIISALLVFVMTMAVGFLEIGEVGERLERSLLKAMLIAGIAIVVMAIIGFNTAFAPDISGLIGNPLYSQGLALGAFSAGAASLLGNVWWSTAASYFNVNLYTSTYFLFEAAFASVTFALVSVVALRKVKLSALAIFSIVYFIIIWNLPAAWIWNPSGWLYSMGVRDFAGGLVVHAAAGAAGLALVVQIWREERRRGLTASPQVRVSVSGGWLTLSVLLLWIGWFGFNAGSVLAFNESALAVAVTTFLAASASLVTMVFVKWLSLGRMPGTDWAANGVIMGLIVITPLAGFVSPGSALVLGVLGALVYVAAERCFSRARWVSDPIGLFPGHLMGGIFGVLMIAFFTQAGFAAASGNANLPNGLLFGGGMAAFSQLLLEAFATLVVLAFVFAVSSASFWLIGKALRGITDDAYYAEGKRRRTKT